MIFKADEVTQLILWSQLDPHTFVQDGSDTSGANVDHELTGNQKKELHTLQGRTHLNV